VVRASATAPYKSRCLARSHGNWQLYPAAYVCILTLVMWKKTCSFLASGVMKPKPLSSFHQAALPFTVMPPSFLITYLPLN